MKLRILFLLLLVLAWRSPENAAAEAFVRANGGWLDVEGGATRGVGNSYQGGYGLSFEAGFALSNFIALSAEFAPSYNQPPRKTPATTDLEGGSYQALTGNLLLRFEPIERLRPYILLGGGQGHFTFDYADSGRVVGSGSNSRRIPDDRLSALSMIVGFGFDSPLTGRLSWGIRGRYFYHRWRPESDEGILYAFPKGEAFAVDAGLKFRF
ncbi:MAG: hypothetical protein FJY88_06615 [Candidatus Eisenbacteria bacterium]|nr:hypothetical protein [Candidatus Eisenbacteria bacterium]